MTDVATTASDVRTHLLDALVTVADLLLTDLETQTVMQRMATVLTQSIPEVRSASVTVQTDQPGRGAFRLVAASDSVSERIDEAQYTAESGPCVEALTEGREVLVPRLPAQQWPAFSAAAHADGVSWSLSLPMTNAHYRGVLNMYAAGDGSYDEARHLEPARVFARYAATILAAHDRYRQATATVGQLHDALVSRATIEQAKGMIMLREQCSPDEAFEILVQTSQRSHRKLRDLAAQLIASVAG